MRFNDGFGDTVSWDLIPQPAISGIDVIPGSNPIFGLNTLGGALAVRTKSGRDFPGVNRRLRGVLRALERRGGVRRLPRPVRLVPHLQRAQRGRLARALAERAAPALHQGRLGRTAPTSGELRLRRQRPHRQRAWRRRACWRGTAAPSTRSPIETRNLMHLGQPAREPVADRRPAALGERVLSRLPAHHLQRRRRGLLRRRRPGARRCSTPSGRLVHLGSCAQGSSAGLVDGAAIRSTATSSARPRARTGRRRPRSQDWGTTLQLSYKGKIFGHGNRVTAGVAYDGHQSRFTQREADADLVPGWQQRGHAADRRRSRRRWTSAPPSRTSASTSPTPSTSPTGWRSRWPGATST